MSFNLQVSTADLIIPDCSSTQDRDEQFAVSRNRAILVSQYLRTPLRLDARHIGTVTFQDQPPAGLSKDHWDGICIVILK
jgi:hypothetical protein